MSGKALKPKEKMNSCYGIVLSFDLHLHQRKGPEPCIFCGQTLMVRNFKGKSVCLNCLINIPSLFSCG